MKPVLSPQFDLTIHSTVRAGPPAIVAQRAGAVRAAAILALTAHPSLLHAAVLLLHDVIADGHGVRNRGNHQTKIKKAPFFLSVFLLLLMLKPGALGIYLPCRLASSSFSSGYSAAPSAPLMPLDGCEDSQSLCSQGRCLLALSSNCRKWKVTQDCGYTHSICKISSLVLRLRSVHTRGSCRLDVLCLSLSWWALLGFFLWAKDSSCLRSSMDFTITSSEPMRRDQRLRGRLEESGATWLLTPC